MCENLIGRLASAVFLPRGSRYDVQIYTDAPTLNTRANVSTAVMTNVKAGRTITLKLLPKGGAALHFIRK